MSENAIRQDAYDVLIEHGLHPSTPRLAIMQYLMTHLTHPTVKDVYEGLCGEISTLSRTTVYNTLRLFSEHNAAQMITIDDHHVCYDSNVTPHVHFYCKKCGKVTDLFGEKTKVMKRDLHIEGNIVDEVCVYYKGICADCAKKR
jgi:Fur family peroxide stress response transcriptional regulator